MKGQTSGIAAVLAAALFILFFMAMIFTFLNFGILKMENVQQTYWGSGVFNPIDDLTFAENIWTFWLVIVMFAVFVFVWQQSQRRAPGQDV